MDLHAVLPMEVNPVSEDAEAMEGTSQSITTMPHPLLIDHVIENIVHHLIQQNDDHSALQSRLVCQLWDTIATKALRTESNKTLYFGKYFHSAEVLMKFIRYLHKSSSMSHFPVGNFYLCEDIFKSCYLPVVQTFFNDCAHLITSLTIRLDNQSDLKVCEVNLDKMQLAHLKSLTLDDRRYVSGANNNIEVIQKPPSLLQGLVKCSPNLHKLTVIHPPPSMFDDDETVSIQHYASERNVAEMLVNHCPKNLHYLNLDIKLNDKVLTTLSKIPVNLTELQLSLRESIFSNESLTSLLEAQKDTLKNIRFCSMGMKSHFEIKFPVLAQLQLLELHSWDCQIQGVTFSKFTYQQHFPALKSLVLHTWAENPSWIQFFPAAYYGTVSTVKSLKLPQNFMYPAMIQNLSWLFPNLKRLDVHFSKDTGIILQRIFHHFRDHLEELKIRDSLPREKFDTCLDGLFTGLPRHICDKILRRKLFDPRPETNYLLMLKSRPSLLNLKNLQKLDIEDILRHETYVTDVTGYLVLLQMPSLRYLHMGRSQIDDECLGHLAKKFPTNMQKELLVTRPPCRINRKMTSSIYCSSLNVYNNCVIS